MNCEKEQITASTSYPTCRIVSPKDGDRVKDIVEIEVEATDDKGVIRVDFHFDGSDYPTGSDYLPPFIYEWNTDYYDDQTQHTIYARAYDTDEHITGSELIAVMIDRSYGPPETSQILSILSYDSTSLKISWEVNRDTDFSSYNLYRQTMPGVNTEGSPHHTKTNQNINTFIDTNLITGQTYYYKLVVTDTEGYHPESDEQWGVPMAVSFGHNHFFTYSLQLGYQNYSVFKYDLDGNSESKILDEGYYGTVSKDGNWLYYRAYSNIWRYNFASNVEEQVTYEPHTHIWPRISEDQTRYCYYESPPARPVYVADIDGSNRQHLPALYGFTNFVFGSNGRLLNRGVVYDLDGNEMETVIELDLENWGILKCEYSTNGDFMVVLAQSPPFEPYGPVREKTQVLLYEIATETLEEVIPESYDMVYDVDFVNTNSGEKILIQERYKIGIIELDGSNYQVLTSVLETSGYKLVYISGAK